MRLATLSLIVTIVFLAICFAIEKAENVCIKAQKEAFSAYHQQCMAETTKKLRRAEREAEHTQEYVLSAFEQYQESQSTEPRCR